MAALNFGAALKLSSHIDISSQQRAKGNDEEISKFLDEIFAIVEKKVGSAPRQIGLVHGSEGRAEIHKIYFFIADKLFFVVFPFVDFEVAGDVDLDDDIGFREEIVDNKDPFDKFFFVDFVLALGLVAKVDRQILRVGVEALEEVEGPVLLLTFEERALFEVIVGGGIGETYWEGVGVYDV